MSTARAIALAVLLPAVLFGCARPIGLFIHPQATRPELRGRTIALLPPVSLGVEHGPAIVALEALEQVFASELAGIRFVPARTLIEQAPAATADLTALARNIAGDLPIPIEVSRNKRRLFARHSLRDRPLDSPLRIALHAGTVGGAPVTPERLSMDALAGIDADLVLLTVAFGAYQETSDVLTLLGILPYGHSVKLSASEPRCLFVLYERASGQRAWASIVGVRGSHFGDLDRAMSESKRVLDPRTLPVVGLAWLWTGDIEEPLARIVFDRSEDY